MNLPGPVSQLAQEPAIVIFSPLWFGGLAETPPQTAATSLTFVSALRRFYGFVYRPRHEADRSRNHSRYFIRRPGFSYDVAPVFGGLLFCPIVNGVNSLAQRLRSFQSGDLNFYLGVAGIFLLGVLLLSIV